MSILEGFTRKFLPWKNAAGEMETDYYQQLERDVPDTHTRKSSKKDFKHAKFKYVFPFLSHNVILNIRENTFLNCKVV